MISMELWRPQIGAYCEAEGSGRKHMGKIGK